MATPGLAGGATGIGSWPGDDIVEALGAVRDILTDRPHLPELPHRGPGADLIGRGAALLVDLPVDLQPHGWRLVDAPGRDQRRAASWLRSDLDALAEAFDGYAGPLKVQVAGPWTLAASLVAAPRRAGAHRPGRAARGRSSRWPPASTTTSPPCAVPSRGPRSWSSSTSPR